MEKLIKRATKKKNLIREDSEVDLNLRKLNRSREWKKKNPEKNRESQKAWKLKNKEYIREYEKNYRTNNKEKMSIINKRTKNKAKLKDPEKFKIKSRNSWYKTRFGLSIEDFNKLFEEQNGCCAICGRHQSEVTKTFHVDHNHTTNKIRELLCPTCNQGLGFFKENIQYLENAIKYIQKHAN